MAFPLRTIACLLLALFTSSGCRPFQPGSVSRLQQPLPTSEELAEGTGRMPLRNNRARGEQRAAATADHRVSANSSQHQLSDTATDHGDSGHSSQGYCASCGVTHGSSDGPPDFRFTQPLPQFTPVSQPRLSQPKPDTSANQANGSGTLPDATYSSAIRVRPLQPEEARTAQTTATRPAPPPQPDDGPEPAANSGPMTIANVTAAASPVATTNCIATETHTLPTMSSDSKTSTASVPPPETANPTSPIRLAAESKSVGEQSATATVASAEEPEVTTGKCSAPEPATEEASIDCLNLAELQETLRSLRGQADLVSTDLGTRLESELNALELLAGRIELLAAGEVEATQAQQSCQHQIAALVATLRPDALDISRPEGRTAATATLEHLRAAITQLESLVSLQVTRGALCSEIRGFGQYKPFPASEFRAGQSVLLYCELENFCSTAKAEAGESGYCTRLKSSLVICREDGSVAQQAEFPVVEDLARNRRRDFYLYVPFTVGELPAGKYRAHLLVDDLLGCKQAVLDPPVEFTVR